MHFVCLPIQRAIISAARKSAPCGSLAPKTAQAILGWIGVHEISPFLIERLPVLRFDVSEKLSKLDRKTWTNAEYFPAFIFSYFPAFAYVIVWFFKSWFISVLIGMEGCAPRRVAANAPAAQPRITAVSKETPSARATENTPTKESPAAVVSTTSTEKLGMWIAG